MHFLFGEPENRGPKVFEFYNDFKKTIPNKRSGTVKYTVNKFSQLLGMSQATLRHYRTMGLLQPEKDEQNGYYYYSQEDAVRTLSIKRYRSLDMPLSGVQEVVGGLSAREQYEWLEKSDEELSQQIERMQAALEHRKGVREYLKMMLEKEGVTEEICWNQPFYGLYFLGAVKDLPPEALIERWTACTPYPYLTVKIPKEELREAGRTEPYHTQVGLGIIEQWQKYCGLPTEPPAERVPGGRSVRIFLKTENLFALSPKDLAPLLDYVQKSDLEILHNSSGWVVVSEFEPERVVYHVLIRVRVQEKTAPG